MTAIVKIVQALEEGDIEQLANVDVDKAALSDDAVRVALRRSAKNVVWHRLHYRTTIQRVIKLGAPCDIWTAARAGLLDEVRKLVADDAGLLDGQDESGRTPLQRAALVYGDGVGEPKTDWHRRCAPQFSSILRLGRGAIHLRNRSAVSFVRS